MKKQFIRKALSFIHRKIYHLFLNILGNYFYRSYWHYRLFGSQKDPNTCNFYLAARPNPGAGIGHQMANWIAGYWYAKKWNLRFAHIPFASRQWEEFLGFGVDEYSLSEVRKKGWKIRRIPLFHEKKQQEEELIKNIISSYTGQKIVFLCEQDQFYRDQYGVMTEIQQKFADAPSRCHDRIQYSPVNLNIAIHVRRGDILLDPNNPNLVMRYLSNDYFDKVLSETISHFSATSKKPIHIYFFSQGSPQDYPEFEKFENLHWCLDMSAQDSFLHMVNADILITSKSSFSYKPALLNKNGIKICPQNFWHGYPETPDWIMTDNYGNIIW